MNPSLSPPGQTEKVRATSVLVLAPHYDDEVLGCGGLLAQLTRAGAVARVLFLSDSDADGEGERRREEARAAGEALGTAGRDRLDLPDGKLDQHLDAIARGIRRALLAQRPELLLTPSPLEASPDHRAVFAALHRLLGGLRPGEPLFDAVEGIEILAYEVNHPLRPDLLVDVTAELPAIERAMAAYPSQQARHDYLGARLGLLRFRALTLDPETQAAEAYRRLALDDFRTRGLARLVAELGGEPDTLAIEDGPLISVVVRTKDRPELLAQALASLTASRYRRLEVVVVNDGGSTPELPGNFPFPVRTVELEENRGRAAAANAGVATATGDYVAFLDDDDLVEPEHFETLAALARAAGVRVAYTDAAVGVYELDPEDGWRCAERRLPYSRDFDPELLLLDNYIPFHTLLVERPLFAEAGGFDEDLPFFEDWDFLIRLAALTPFHHLARVTCEYRHFRGGGHHVLGDRPRLRDDFLAMKARVIEKHAERRSALSTARSIDLLRAEAIAEGERSARLREEKKALERALRATEERYHDLNGQLDGMRIHQRVLEESERRAREALRQRERQVLELEHQAGEHSRRIGEQDRYVEELVADVREQSSVLEATRAEIDRLNRLIAAMESTRAWRLHRWLERFRR